MLGHPTATCTERVIFSFLMSGSIQPQNANSHFFQQFTKSGLGQYAKFSLFTHGRGDYVMALMSSANVPLHPNDVRDLILTAKGMYEAFSLFFFGVQGETQKVKLLSQKLMDSQTK